MAKDPLGSFTPPPETEDPVIKEEVVEDDPVVVPPKPGDPPAPAPEAVDAKGVPWKNRAAEARRKEALALERAKRLETDLETTKGTLSTLEATVQDLKAKVATPPASTNGRPAQASPWNAEELAKRPLNQWPSGALRQLAIEDPSWTEKVDAILSDRMAEQVATKATATIELTGAKKRMDAEIVGAYPDMRKRDSALYTEAARVTVEWGVDLEKTPMALKGIVREAAERLGVSPRVIVPREGTDRGADLSVLNPDGEVRTTDTRRGNTPKVSLTPDQQLAMRTMGVDPEKMAAEVARTNKLPVIGPEE